MERDEIFQEVGKRQVNFNSHAHVERDQINIPTSIRFTNFNSHAHVERDDAAEENGKLIDISTHTLTWSVTTL